jgi:hypothetical protein
VKLFLILIAPAYALVLFVQAMRGLNTLKSRAVKWRGEIHSRQDSPALFWGLVVWNAGLTIGLVVVYSAMWIETLTGTP